MFEGVWAAAAEPESPYKLIKTENPPIEWEAGSFRAGRLLKMGELWGPGVRCGTHTHVGSPPDGLPILVLHRVEGADFHLLPVLEAGSIYVLGSVVPVLCLPGTVVR